MNRAAFSNYIKIFRSLYDKFFPIVSKFVKEKSILKPWITDSLINRIKIRDNLSIKCSKGRIDRQIYTKFRNKLNDQLKIAKANYFHAEFAKCHGNGKKTWNIINRNINRCNKSKIISLKENDNLISNERVPSSFIDFFSNVANQLISKVAPSYNNPSKYLRNRNKNSFAMGPIIKEEVELAISQLRSSNPLLTESAAILDYVKSAISPQLSEIFNLCICQGYFPNELKLGRITPIHKKGSKMSLSNYRPVCNLSPYSKIFEKIVFNRMSEFLTKYNIISDTQFGFRKGMGTDSALINFIDYVHRGQSKKHNVGAIFMDLSKAFDVMDHQLLKLKLDHYGFRGVFLEFLMSYLDKREYYVHVNGLDSDTKVVNVGVPQGSTLGPLLFLLFINDMKHCSSLLKFLQFADDTTIVLSSPDITELNEILEREGNKVLEWFSCNKLILNLEKTNCMLFSNKRHKPYLNIKLFDQVIKQVNETTFLGVVIDDKLTWKSHIKHVSSKISKSIAILNFFRNIFPKPVLRMLYMSLIHCHLNYCNIVWGSAYKTVLDPLYKLQKKAVRLINGSKYLEHTEPIFRKLNILNIHMVFELNCLLFIYKCTKMGKFQEFSKLLIKKSSIYGYSTRNNDQFRPPCSRLDIVKRSFFTTGINLWNIIDDEIKGCPNIFKFKNKVKINLLQ